VSHASHARRQPELPVHLVQPRADQCHGNQFQAARLLGMPRRTLVERLRAYGVTRKLWR
jgi:DNA-binding protein Fis